MRRNPSSGGKCFLELGRCVGVPGGIRTPDPLLRRQPLYPSAESDLVSGGGYIPEVVCTVWLKPFDLAVSEELTLLVPTDAETGEYIAEVVLRRLSGTRESWLRLNVGFVGAVRRHLLHWRAVPDGSRQEMFAEGRALLHEEVLGHEAPQPQVDS